MSRAIRIGVVALSTAVALEAGLFWLGRSYGSTRKDRAAPLPGDDIVSRPKAITDHAITIGVPPALVWPWLVQMGWHRGGWYTARWVDRLLFPANWPSATRILPELQDLRLGDFIPDGPPETRCGLLVERLEPERALVLHSTSHLPLSWRERHRAGLDWSWVFVLTPLDDGRHCRFHFRSRWVTAPWWLTVGAWLVLVPADFVMARAMLRGVRARADRPCREAASTGPAERPRGDSNTRPRD